MELGRKRKKQALAELLAIENRGNRLTGEKSCGDCAESAQHGSGGGKRGKHLLREEGERDADRVSFVFVREKKKGCPGRPLGKKTLHERSA